LLLLGYAHASIKEVMIVFESLEAIWKFKHECTCNDFYVDRDRLTPVGFFKPEHIRLAADKFDARLRNET
jgi:hypothetical protein